MENKPNDRFLRRQPMLAMTGLPQSTAYLLMKRGQFPKSYKISPRLVAWKESELRAWMDSRPGYQPQQI